MRKDGGTDYDLSTNADSPEMEKIMPSVIVLLSSLDAAVIKILKEIGFCKINRYEQSCIEMNTIKSYCCKRTLNNASFEISKSRLYGKRLRCYRLGCCEEISNII